MGSRLQDFGAGFTFGALLRGKPFAVILYVLNTPTSSSLQAAQDPYMNYSLNSLKGVGYVEDYKGDYSTGY